MRDEQNLAQESNRIKRNVLIVLGMLGVAVLVATTYGFYWLAYDMERLPKGEFISEATSPDGTYTLKAYVSNGGATTSLSVLGELNFNKEQKKPQNIYWNDREDKAKIEWLDKDTVVINGHELDVPDEIYDFRRE